MANAEDVKGPDGTPREDPPGSARSAGEGSEYAGLVRPPVGSIQPIRDVPEEFIFRFEMGPAILAQLLEKLAQVPLVPLLECQDAKYPGFYHIHYRGKPTYVGRSSRPLRERLREHVSKLSGRRDSELGQPLDLKDVTVKYVFVEDPSLVDVSESALISFFNENDLAPWAGTGYGSKVAGAGRKGQAASDWEDLFPPDWDAPITAGGPEPVTLRQLVTQVKKQAPVGLFIPRNHSKQFTTAHPSKVRVSRRSLPFREWIHVLSGFLAPGWEIEETDTGWYVQPPRT